MAATDGKLDERRIVEGWRVQIRPFISMLCKNHRQYLTVFMCDGQSLALVKRNKIRNIYVYM